MSPELFGGFRVLIVSMQPCNLFCSFITNLHINWGTSSVIVIFQLIYLLWPSAAPSSHSPFRPERIILDLFIILKIRTTLATEMVLLVFYGFSAWLCLQTLDIDLQQRFWGLCFGAAERFSFFVGSVRSVYRKDSLSGCTNALACLQYSCWKLFPILFASWLSLPEKLAFFQPDGFWGFSWVHLAFLMKLLVSISFEGSNNKLKMFHIFSSACEV